MARKKAKKRLQNAGPSLMDRTRASVRMLNGTNSNDRTKMFAFLSLFHPEMSLTERLKLANGAGKKD